MFRTLAAGQRSRILLAGPETARPIVLFETGELLVEAPNWSLDGSSLYVNAEGALWRLAVGDPGAGLEQVPFRDLPELNNDHVLDPDGRHIFMSAGDGHIYRGELHGGEVARVTPEDGMWHFLHGVSPDGTRLAYVELVDFDRPGRLAILSSQGGTPASRQPFYPQTGEGHLDGPEWTPDGRFLVYNTEAFTDAAGHAQLARIPDGGGEPERLVASDTVDWFPHVSPDGRWATYLSFPSGTQGHPADVDVTVHVVATADWRTSVQRYDAFGGQGTLNVNGWSPDSTRFAFVDYPVTA